MCDNHSSLLFGIPCSLIALQLHVYVRGWREESARAPTMSRPTCTFTVDRARNRPLSAEVF